MEQLTIFKVLNEFDENLANWVNVFDNHEHCTVLANIPEDALAPTEMFGLRWDDPMYIRQKKLWGDHATAIWDHVSWIEGFPSGTSWTIACDRLKEYRDAKKPCFMVITRSHRYKGKIDFKPKHVVKYL
jgi:hypothetical protein